MNGRRPDPAGARSVVDFTTLARDGAACGLPGYEYTAERAELPSGIRWITRPAPNGVVLAALAVGILMGGFR